MLQTYGCESHYMQTIKLHDFHCANTNTSKQQHAEQQVGEQLLYQIAWFFLRKLTKRITTKQTTKRERKRASTTGSIEWVSLCRKCYVSIKSSDVVMMQWHNPQTSDVGACEV